MELIDKADVVAEIKRIMDAENESINSFEHHRNTSEKQQYNARMALLERILFLLNTLEVKDVDLDKEARHYLLYEHESPLVTILHQVDLRIEMQYHKDIENAFKAGVKFGLNARKEEQHDKRRN